jgi:endonuclease-3
VKTAKRKKVKSTTLGQRRRAGEILAELKKLYPDAHCELDYKSPHELLIATILSAQATDVGVNRATPALFKRFPAPVDYAKSTPAQIEPFVKSLGFFRQKAKSVHAAMTAVVNEFNGEVPRTMEELLTLRGVARKTANVVLGNAFGINVGVVVDTHVIRLVSRLGLSKHTDPAKIERDLMALFPQDDWTLLSHLLIWHGRRACKARGGTCSEHRFCRRFCSNSDGNADKSNANKSK